MYEGKRLITPETKNLSRPGDNSLEERSAEKWTPDSGEGIRFAYSVTPLPERVEFAHFESGSPEVIGPDPNETFSLPFDGPSNIYKKYCCKTAE